MIMLYMYVHDIKIYLILSLVVYFVINGILKL